MKIALALAFAAYTLTQIARLFLAAGVL